MSEQYTQENCEQEATPAAPDRNGHHDGGEEIPTYKIKLKIWYFYLEDESGSKQKMFLREFSGSERDDWLDYVGKKAKMGRGGQPRGLKNNKLIIAELISRHLHYENGERVPVSFVQAKIPAGLQGILVAKASDMSGLTIEAGDEEKND